METTEQRNVREVVVTNNSHTNEKQRHPIPSSSSSITDEANHTNGNTHTSFFLWLSIVGVVNVGVGVKQGLLWTIKILGQRQVKAPEKHISQDSIVYVYHLVGVSRLFTCCHVTTCEMTSGLATRLDRGFDYMELKKGPVTGQRTRKF